MPEWLQAIFNFFGRFRIFYIVMPWEQAIRVRLGSRVKLVGPGFHWKFPFLDRVFTQNIRLHVVSSCSQTLEGEDGKAIAVVACIGFSIRSLLDVYKSVQHLDEALYSWASAEIAERIGGDCTREQLEALVTAGLEEKAGSWGIKVEFCRITDYARVRVFRLMQSDRWSRPGPDLDAGAR